jgi:hypothetical protein
LRKRNAGTGSLDFHGHIDLFTARTVIAYDKCSKKEYRHLEKDQWCAAFVQMTDLTPNEKNGTGGGRPCHEY